MKLTASQIAIIAQYCEDICKRHPSFAVVEGDTDDDCGVCEALPIPEKGEIPRMEDWEVELKGLIDANPNLPAYEDDGVDMWVEYLISYFA